MRHARPVRSVPRHLFLAPCHLPIFPRVPAHELTRIHAGALSCARVPRSPYKNLALLALLTWLSHTNAKVRNPVCRPPVTPLLKCAKWTAHDPAAQALPPGPGSVCRGLLPGASSRPRLGSAAQTRHPDPLIPRSLDPSSLTPRLRVARPSIPQSLNPYALNSCAAGRG